MATHKWKDVRTKYSKLSSERRAAIDHEVQMEALRLTLKELRERVGKTQEEVAAATRLTQPQISKLESGRVDPQLSTLRVLLEGMGAQLKVSAELPDGTTVPLDIVPA